MRKINKDLSLIPTSLKPPTSDYFFNTNRPSKVCKTTHLRRQEIIDNGGYIDTDNYNSRYKYSDVKTALNNLYHKKCAFCEQRVEVPHVEHFRPKSIYYWLAYSWDNLLLACSTCNSLKGNRFNIIGLQYSFVFNATNTYKNIHSSCAMLDNVEQPLLINPETEDSSSDFIFDKNGGVRSNNLRVAHTINECGLSRDDLKYQRKKILDDFKRDVESSFLENSGDIDKLKAEIGAYIKQFFRRSQSSEESFTVFRRYGVENSWLNEIIKELN